MRHLWEILFLLPCVAFAAPSDLIEKQLEEIGKIPSEEVIVIQRKYSRKALRSEITPLTFGGMPFGTVRRTLVGGASYTLHLNDWFAWEALQFLYNKNMFSGFTTDINASKSTGLNPNQDDIRPDFQKLLFFLNTGIQWTPFYGKLSTFSRWIAYIEPYLSLGLGVATTERNSYFAYYPGIGLRVYFREWVSMRVDFRDYLYTENFTDRTTGSASSALRNNYMVTVSLSFWAPKMDRLR